MEEGGASCLLLGQPGQQLVEWNAKPRAGPVMGDVELVKAEERGVCGGRLCAEHDLLIVILAEIALKCVCGAGREDDVWAGIVIVGVGMVRVVQGWVGQKAGGLYVSIEHIFDGRRSKVRACPIWFE